MFVGRLNTRQQSLLLTLSKQLIAADGNIHDKEHALLASLQVQMAPGVEDASGLRLDEEFQSTESKVSLLLELLGLAHADQDYHLTEKDFIAKVAKAIGVDANLLADMESWVVRQLALVREAEAFMEG